MKTLTQFIECVGDETAADLFKVTTRTAVSWRRKERTPRPKQIPTILSGAKDHECGPLTVEGIYS